MPMIARGSTRRLERRAAEHGVHRERRLAPHEQIELADDLPPDGGGLEEQPGPRRKKDEDRREREQREEGEGGAWVNASRSSHA